MSVQEAEITALQTTGKGVIEKRKNKIFVKIVKRSVDIVVGIIGVTLLVPLTIGIYIARKIFKEDDGPIFYEQLRIGKNGKLFRMYKYRSMVMNADERLEKYLEENKEARREYDRNKKLKKDPRVTKLGLFLRKTSLDEIPQFINVLKGEMSLVGPRPYLPKEKEDMGIYYDKIVKCKPGITGLWQISGRSGTTFQDRLNLEKYYIENKSFLLDIKILMKTFIVIIKKEGAI